MASVTNSSMAIRLIKMQDLARMTAKLAETAAYSIQSEPYQGRTPKIPATRRTYEELALYFAKMGVFGEGAYLDAISNTIKYPHLAVYNQEDGLANDAKVFAEENRAEPAPAQRITPAVQAINEASVKKRIYSRYGSRYAGYGNRTYTRQLKKRTYPSSADAFRQLRIGHQSKKTYTPRFKKQAISHGNIGGLEERLIA